MIYALRCPLTEQIHYIGKSTSGFIRPTQHMTNSHSIKVHKWVEELKLIGHKPIISILKEVSEFEDIDTVEAYYIRRSIESGDLLLNDNLVKVPTILPTLDKTDPTGLKSIGVFIKKKRQQTGLTQSDFANRIGVALTVVRKLEQGSKKGLNTKSVNAVLAVFGYKLGLEKIEPTKCKYVKRDGESCTLNNNCTYPNCK